MTAVAAMAGPDASSLPSALSAGPGPVDRLRATAVPVDLGRTARTFTGEQRRAVIARDRGCLWPDCDRPPRWCEVHHLRWWDRDGGETSIDCGALVCSFHHHEIHRLALTATRHMLDPDEAPPGTSRAHHVLTRSDGTVVAGRPPAQWTAL